MSHCPLFMSVVVVLTLLSPSPLLADGASVAGLAGCWTYDAARSRPIAPDLLITTTANGTLRAEGSSGSPFEFDLVGGSYPLSNGRTITWTPTTRDRWNVTKTKNGDVFETATVTLAGNTLSVATRGKLPDGSAYERTVTYRRQEKGKGLAGRWRSIRVDTGATWDGFVISTSEDGVVTWRIPTDLQVFTGRVDGSDLPIVGPNGPTGSTIALRTERPGHFAYESKDRGQITERGTITISRDRRWLLEETWSVDQPRRKGRLFYRRGGIGVSGAHRCDQDVAGGAGR